MGLMALGSEFWAAIMGAVVAGTIGLVTQLVALWANARQRAKDEKNRKAALGHSLIFKVVRIHANFYALNKYFKESFAKAEKDGLGGEPWQMVRPVANSPDPVHFSADEMSLVLSFKNEILFNDILSLDEIHNSTLSLFHTFRDLRQALMSQLPSKMEGMIGKTVLSEQEMLFLRPKMVELNDLIESMMARCDEDVQHAARVLPSLVATLNEALNLSVKVQFRHNQ